MKKKILSKRHLIQNFNLLNYKWNLRATIIYKLTFISLLFFTSNFLQAQAVISQPFDANGSVIVPNGLTLMNIQAWGAGGSGGGAANAPNGEGRGGAGGGGGARATASITVVPGATIRAIVAGSVAGGPGNGTAGGSSTIEGYENIISASGGLGGPANTTGGPSQQGGLGGSTGAGAISAGGQGGASGTSTLSILFSSGSGGSSPGGSGTTAGVGSIILGVNSAGYTGGIPGGGGTGAMNANGGAAQNGGASGHGRVIIGYTCPTYNFTTITADGACVSNGNTIVRLTGTTASLPVGTYNVTYSRTTPNATGQTATMTVTTAGSGTFTASGFTTVGTTSTVTVTAINSQACTSTKSSGNSTSVTVYAAPIGGSITGGSTICSGASSGPLTLSGHTGTVQKWQYSFSPFTTWTDLANSAGTYFTIGPLTQNTRFRAVVTNGTCTPATSGEVTVNVNPLPSLTVSSVTPVCFNSAAQTTALNYTNAMQSPTTYSITWNTTPTNSFLAVTDASLPANAISIAIPAGTAPGTYTGSLTVKNSNCTSAAIPFSVVINPLPTITTTGTVTAVCQSATNQTSTLAYTATTNTPTRYSIDWATLTDQGPTSISFSSGAGNITGINVPANTAPGTYPGTLTIYTANNCSVNQAVSLVVNPLPTITTTGTVTAVCQSTANQTTVLPYTATTNTPTSYSIDWATLADQGSTSISFSSGAGNITGINVPANTAAGTYPGTLTIYTANNCSVNQAISLVVNPLPQGSLTANGPFCATGAGQLTFTATAGTGPYTIVYNDGTADRTATNVISGTPFNVSTPVNATTTYTLVSVTGANSCARSSGFTGISAVITINSTPVPTFTAQAAASVCINTSQTYTTQSGQSNYIWTISGTQGTDYTILSGGTSNTSNSVTLQWNSIGNKTVTVGYSSNNCPSTVNASNTTLVTKTDRGVVNGGSHICSGSPSPLLTLNNYSGTIVRWEYAEAIPYVWQPISHTSNTYQPGILTTSTSFRAIVKNGTCPEESAIETRIDVEPKPSVPIFGTIVQPTCVNPVGSVVLNNLPASPNWTITQSGTVNQTYSSTGTNFTIANLSPGNYTFTVHNLPFCMSDATINLEIKAPVTNIWDGTSWSKGSAPIITDAIRFSGNYTLTGDLSGCSCVVDSGVNVTVGSDHTLTIVNSVTNSGGTFIFENNASLLQTTDAVNTGNIVYRRNTTPVRRYDFTRWSSPVTRTPAFKLNDLSPNTLGDKYYKYNGNTAAGWVIIGQGNEEMLKGIGYSIRAPQNFDINIPEVFYGEFIGVPNNGPVSIPLAGDQKWVLIGNPYPSAVYADRFIVDNQTNLYGTLYFWTHNSKPSSSVPGSGQYNYTEDDYAIYNLSGSTSPGSMTGDGASTPGNQIPPLGYIAAGQSFFVQSKTTATAVFTNSMRVPGSNSQFYKTIDSKKAEEEKHRVWINLRNEQGAFKQILIGYVEGATDYWDNNYDAVTMNANKYLDFYSINEENKLVIQGRALPWQERDVVPLGYQANIAGEFFVEIDHADGNLNSLPIFLIDKKTGAVHNLQNERYIFNTTIGTFDDRFSIHYSKSNLGVDDVEKFDKAIYVSVQNQVIKINAAATQENIKDIMVYDASGKLIFTKKNVGEFNFEISDLHAQHQVLIVKVILENGHMDSRKVIF